MSSQNQVSVCNIALLSIGSRSQISALNEQSVQGNACNTLYQFVFENLARTALWNCLRKEATLTLLQAAQGTPENPQGTTYPIPPTPWLYAYQLPSDCLQARWLVPTLPSTGNNPISPAMVPAATWIPNNGKIPFQVATITVNNNPVNVILTNLTQAQLVYTTNISNPQIWDSSFTAAYVASLGAYLVPALAMNMALIPMQIKIAEGIIANARARDGNEGSVSNSRQASWMAARQIGAGWGYGSNYGNNLVWGGYSNMCWPSY